MLAPVLANLGVARLGGRGKGELARPDAFHWVRYRPIFENFDFTGLEDKNFNGFDTRTKLPHIRQLQEFMPY
jgi:hypothetical protein